MRAVTYNIHHGAGGLERAIEALRPLGGDVLFLQDVERGTRRGLRADQADAIGKALGLHVLFAPAYPIDEGENGVAILSKEPLRSMRVVGLPHEVPHENLPRSDDGRYEPRVLLTARLGDLTVACARLGVGEFERKSQANVIIAALLDADDVLIGADMGEGPDGGAVGRLKDDFVDAFAAAHGHEGSTVPADKGHFRSHFLFASGALRPVSASIGQHGPGDYRPVTVDFA